MALTKEKKIKVLDKIRQATKESASMVFVNFHGLKVSAVDELRSNLRSEGTSYMVAKKTLVKIALSEGGFEGETPELEGEVAIAYGDDLLLPAKGVYDFSKSNPDLIKIAGGVFEGRFMSAEEMTTVAKIPPREVLLGQLVNVINSPIQGLVMALDQIAKKQEA